MDSASVIRIAREIAKEADFNDAELDASNFLDFSNVVRDVIKAWPKDRQENTPWLSDFARGIRELRDDFLEIVRRDPMVLYKPAHQAALEFHQSNAYIRYFRAPNRTSKTQSGAADNYWIMTGQHPFRKRPPLPASVAIVAVNFAKQASAVYIPKYYEGEGGNPLSPIFPETGKWFYHWDKRKYIMQIACPECANAGKNGSCPHPKSKLYLFSDVEGPLVFAGGQYAQIQFDEQISYKFFAEALKRLETVPNSGLIVTETPLGGKGFWTHKTLTVDLWRRNVMVPGTDMRMCSLHTCTQYEAGLTPKEKIDASRLAMTEQEAEARVFGRPAAFSRTAVFDNAQIGNMMEEAKEPLRGDLFLKHLVPPPEEEAEKLENHYDELQPGVEVEDLLCDADDDSVVGFIESMDGMLRIWEKPRKHAQYVIGADVAHGLIGQDASCAQVLRMQRRGLTVKLTHVASLHGWINSIDYAPLLFKLGLYYNCAWLVPERRGPGDATIKTLVDLNCWFLLRDTTDPANAVPIQDVRFGLDTNVKTKGIFISILQNTIWDRVRERRMLDCWDIDTLEELGSYGQEESPSGKTVTFRGESGTPDDRVIGLALAAYAARECPLYDFYREDEEKQADYVEESGISDRDAEFWDRLRQEQAEEMLEEEGLND